MNLEVKPRPRNVLVRFWDSFVLAPLRGVQDEARDYLQSEAGRRLDAKVLTVLVSTAVLLTLQYYFLRSGEFAHTRQLLHTLGLGTLGDLWWDHIVGPGATRYAYLMFWALFNFFLYFIIPGVIVVLCFRQPLADYGFKFRGALKDGWVYPVFFAVMVPLVLLVSRNAHFQETYPFYQMPDGELLWPWFWLWEAAYAVQFLGLEFFFRGYMVHGLRHRFGPYSIPVMTIPYCMIHYGKPLPESLAAIVAGLVLGFMSLKTRSVILGAAIHVSVALTMDFTSLWRRGFFG
jgi:membrane protease YdiL (CAAX protease family)